MNHLFLAVILLTFTCGSVLADEEKADTTTVTIENATIPETLSNEIKNQTDGNQISEPIVTKPRNKWDFSDHQEDKPKNNQSAADKTSKDKYDNRPATKPKEKWSKKVSGSTTKSLTTDKIKTTKFPVLK